MKALVACTLLLSVGCSQKTCMNKNSNIIHKCTDICDTTPTGYQSVDKRGFLECINIMDDCNLTVISR